MNVEVRTSNDSIYLGVSSFNALHEDADHKRCDSKVEFLTHPGCGKLETYEELPDRSFRHQIEISERRLRLPPHKVKEIVEIRLIQLGLQDMDSRAFKNCCSEAVEQILKRPMPWGEEKLLRYRGIWERDIHRMTKQLDPDSKFDWTGSGLHCYLKFLEQCIKRRSMMLAWLALYHKVGSDAALRYAESQSVHLI